MKWRKSCKGKLTQKYLSGKHKFHHVITYLVSDPKYQTRRYYHDIVSLRYCTAGVGSNFIVIVWTNAFSVSVSMLDMRLIDINEKWI